jgi:uncharacterized membrane protein
MRKGSRSVGGTLVAGILVIAPVYLGVLLLLKAMKSLAGLLKPFAGLLPDGLPGEGILSLLLVLVFCYLVGLAIRTSPGQAIRQRIERSVFEKIPGYALFRSLTQRLAGESEDEAWTPALVEIEDAFVPAFIIEELADGRYTVFVPSVPTPLAGALYVLSHDRVHPLDVPFTQAMKTISRWGSGCKDLVAAMESTKQQGATLEGEGIVSRKTGAPAAPAKPAARASAA